MRGATSAGDDRSSRSPERKCLQKRRQVQRKESEQGSRPVARSSPVGAASLLSSLSSRPPVTRRLRPPARANDGRNRKPCLQHPLSQNVDLRRWGYLRRLLLRAKRRLPDGHHLRQLQPRSEFSLPPCITTLDQRLALPESMEGHQAPVREVGFSHCDGRRGGSDGDARIKARNAV